MVTHAAKAMFFFLLFAMVALPLAQTPYSDAAFRTFISISVDGTTINAKVTFLNITYFRELNATKLEELGQQVKDSQNLEELHQPGDYSDESFTMEVLPLNASPLYFTFEGMPVLDGSGDEICNPVKTDEDGLASCDINFYKDANGELKTVEEYNSCGYATINAGEFTKDGVSYLSSSQTATICPEGVFALSAFAPAITSEVGSNLLFCFPAMLIAGLLVAAMYYSGRDPLSLFDITTPKLPRTPGFKVKMQTSPQMLRQVQRRYKMMKLQARRDSVREIARLAKRNNMSASEARRAMNDIYDKVEAQMRSKDKMSDDGKRALHNMIADLMSKYSPMSRGNKYKDDAALIKRFERSLAVSSGLLEAYIESHQAYRAMGEARGKTGKGGLWSRYVSARMVEKGLDTSVEFEQSRVGRVLGRIPFVKKAVGAPTRMLDVASQLRGSRQSLKAIRGELLGQVAYMLGTKTALGKPLYRAFKGAHVKGDGKAQTRFGKAYSFITGRDWRTFEKKHDLAHKRLVDYYDTTAMMRQHAIDAQNFMFKDLFGKLIFALPVRANLNENAKAVQALAKKIGMSQGEIDKIGKTNALGDLFTQIREKIGKKDRAAAEKLISNLQKALEGMPVGKGLDKLQQKIDDDINGMKASGMKTTLHDLSNELKHVVETEKKMSELLGKRFDTQTEFLDAIAKLVRDRGGLEIGYVTNEISKLRDAENVLRENLHAYLANGEKDDNKKYYQILDKTHITTDIKSGMPTNKLEEKYGKEIARLVKNPELLANLADIRKATTGKALRDAIGSLTLALGLAGAAKDELDMLASTYGGKKRLSADDFAKIAAKLDAMDSLRGLVDGKVFGKFDEKGSFNEREMAMKEWLLEKRGRNYENLLDRYEGIAKSFNDRLAGRRLDIEEVVREGCAFGKNPLELVIEKALRESILNKAKETGMDPAEANALAKDMLDFMRQKTGRLKDMDSLEQFFKPKAGGEARDPAFAAMLRRLDPALTSEHLFKGAAMNIERFAQLWGARNYAITHILSGDDKAGAYMANYANATNGLNKYIKMQMAYLGGEKEQYRKELGMSDYKLDGLESSIYTLRGWEKLFGFIVSEKFGGTSRGEQVLHMLGAAREDYTHTLKRYEALYRNLTDDRSVFYDKDFTAGDGKKLSLEAYEALLKRGYTWQDKKNGLELLMSVDRKSTPMLEYEKDKGYCGSYKDANGNVVYKDEIILKKEFTHDGKADIRDYSQLLARTMGSNYSTREVGFVVLMNKDGKWVYGDPFLAKGVQESYETAEKKVTMRREKMEEMVGKGDIRVISTKDFVTYAKDKNYADFFGKYNAMDRFRETLRSSLYKPGMLWGEVIYGAYSDRLDKMSQWYAAQWQVRQTLDRLKNTMKDEGEGMMGGRNQDSLKGRFKYDEKWVDSIYDPTHALNYAPGKTLSTVNADDETRDKLEKEMKKLSKGDGTFTDSAKAWWHNWHGRVASNIIGEIGKAESDYFNARLELRALEKIKGDIGSAEYKRLRGEIVTRNEELRSEYKHAKSEFMGLNRDLIGWVGSMGGMTYAPQRTVWNFGLVSKALDSHFVQGTQDAFYNITESSVMRDPRVAIGASAPGWDHSYYVGYHTGQNVYERARFWATNSLWEQQMRFSTDIVYTVHKWWNDRMSFFARYTSGYPATVKSDMMYAPHYEARKTSDYFKALFVIMPFQSRTYSDYFRARWQDAITFSGAGSMLAAYQSLGNVERYGTPGEGEEKRSWLRKQIDKYGMESDHYYSTPFRIASQQRYIDQVNKFDDYVNRKGAEIRVTAEGEEMSLAEARNRLRDAAAAMNIDGEEKYKQAIFDAVGKVANLKDRRGRYVREVFSGSDIQEDGSRNRFLDMYTMFHSNVFTPTIPGMMHFSPIGKQEWHSFPQVAREVDKAEDKTRLGAMKNYWQAGYDRDSGRITFTDKFTTKQDAVAEAYKNDVPVLMHLMKMQSKEIGYSIINSPSLSYVNPIWFGLGRKLYKTAIHHTPGMEGFTSTFQEPDWTPGPVKKVKHYMASRGVEKEPDARRAIYENLPGYLESLADRAEKSSSFFRWVRDGVYGAKFRAAPGRQPISKKSKKDLIGNIME